MKDEKGKTLFVFILIIVIICFIVFVFWKKNNKDEYQDVDDQVKEKVNNVIDYVAYTTKYYSSKFDGVDILFDKDQFTIDDVSIASKLRLATLYVSKELNASISNTLINQIVNNEGLNSDNYTFYEGKKIRQAIKELFGIDFKDQSVLNEKDFKYNYQYFKDYDVYAVSSNDSYVSNDAYQIDYKVLSTKENKDGDIKVELVVAYVYVDNAHSSLKYSSKSDLSDLVYEVKIDDAGIKEEEKFTKYNIFLKKSDNNYVFEKIEKIK